ncbi:MAG: hypothetical protein ABIH90_00425 [Candidatus Aenigmatarchaeota archaeon]
MQRQDMNMLDKFTTDFVEVIERFVEYIIVSGFVAISHGRSRGTEDVDVIVRRMPEDKLNEMHMALDAAGFECLQSEDAHETYSYLISNESARYVRKGKMLPQIELKFSKDALDEYQLDKKTKLPLTGLDFWFSTVETNIAFKEELLKSEKDMDDAKHLRTVYAGKLDEKEIMKVKTMIRRFRLS